jgi:purine-cytosine permease-like protein
MVLMPMGAIIFVDFWLSRRLGFQPDYAERAGISVNWAAALTWLIAVAACVALVQAAGVQIYFVSLPGWFIAALSYTLLSRMLQQPAARLAAVATLGRVERS